MTRTTRLPKDWKIADLLQHLGDIDPKRIRLDPPPGRATVRDLIRVNDRQDRPCELVGINFDRNRHGLVRNFLYTDERARHVAVHCRAVLEALRKLYDAPGLVRELTGK